MNKYGQGFLDGWKKFGTAIITLIFAGIAIVNGGGEVDQAAIESTTQSVQMGIESMIMGGGLVVTIILEILDRINGKSKVIKK